MANPKDSTSVTIKRSTKELLDEISTRSGYPKTVILDLAIKKIKRQFLRNSK